MLRVVWSGIVRSLPLQPADSLQLTATEFRDGAKTIASFRNGTWSLGDEFYTRANISGPARVTFSDGESNACVGVFPDLSLCGGTLWASDRPLAMLEEGGWRLAGKATVWPLLALSCEPA